MPIGNYLPSLGLNRYILQSGAFPSQDIGSGPYAGYIASIHTFAGVSSTAPGVATMGQVLGIAQNTALFALLGTQYGGNGQTNFALPNLVGRTTLDAGQGAGLTGYFVGDSVGSATVDLAPNPGGAPGSLRFSNVQPSTAITYGIATTGIYPSSDGGGGPGAIGSVVAFAGNFVPAGYIPADGRLLDIGQNVTLYQLIGTTYGGDGVDTFAVPDFRGRSLIGISANTQLGQVGGSETTVITTAQMPTNMGGSGAPISNAQPTIGVQYLIALQGIYPQAGSSNSSNTPFLGEIITDITNIVPRGYARADGQLLPINQNQALFSLFGTTYGGNGTTNFALPDLRDRTVIGAGVSGDVSITLGERTGSSTFTLTSADIPAMTFDGTGGGDMLYGGDVADVIGGLGGHDRLTGNGGADRLTGGLGDDTVNGGAGNDTLDGGQGIDTATYELDGQVVAANLFGGFAVQNFGQPGAAVDTLILIENVTGGSSDDFLIGDNTANRLEGGGGADNLWGYGGNDTLIGGDGNDIIVGGDNDDSLESGIGQDWLYGQGGADTLRATDATANAFNVLVGGDGNDTLFGGPTGFDYFYGGDGVTGGGNDTFIIVANSGIKVMNDFEAGGVNDVVRLTGTALTTFAQVQAKLSFSATINGTVLVVDGATQVWFLGLQPNQLTASDFTFA